MKLGFAILLLFFSCACQTPGIQKTPAIIAPQSQSLSAVSADLTLATWNINKRDAANSEIELLVSAFAPDILCLQEVTTDTCALFDGIFDSCRFAPSWNMHGEVYTGVLTASRFEFTSIESFLSPNLELYLFTPKASMIVKIGLPNGKELMVINIHALNFVPIGLLEGQLEKLYAASRGHEGPLIACGDFNTWSSDRLKATQQFAARLGMVEALAYHENGGVPSRWALFAEPFIEIDMDAPLDRIFCRGFEVVSCTRLAGFASSDHIPLLLKVRYIR